MQEVKNRLSIVEKNIEKLIRKLSEYRDNNEKLLVENNLLKKENAELAHKIENFHNIPNAEAGESVRLIKAEIAACREELENCIELVENT